MRRNLFLAAVAAALLSPVVASAQAGGGGGNGGGNGGGGAGGGAGGGGRRGQGGAGGGPGGGGNFDPAQFQQQRMTRLKEEIGATDEEWAVLSPKVEKVMTVQREAGAGAGGMGGGRRGGGGAGGPGGGGAPGGNADSAVAKALQELQTTLANKDASAEEISGKLTALRTAKEKAKADLLAAQKELKELVNARQEAVLVERGMLE